MADGSRTGLLQQCVDDQPVKRVQIALASNLQAGRGEGERRPWAALGIAHDSSAKGSEGCGAGSFCQPAEGVLRAACNETVPVCNAAARLLVPLTRGRDRSTDTFHHMRGSLPPCTKRGWAVSMSCLWRGKCVRRCDASDCSNTRSQAVHLACPIVHERTTDTGKSTTHLHRPAVVARIPRGQPHAVEGKGPPAAPFLLGQGSVTTPCMQPHRPARSTHSAQHGGHPPVESLPLAGSLQWPRSCRYLLGQVVEILAIAVRVPLLVRLADAQAAARGILGRCGTQLPPPVPRPTQGVVYICGGRTETSMECGKLCGAFVGCASSSTCDQSISLPQERAISRHCRQGDIVDNAKGVGPQVPATRNGCLRYTEPQTIT